jgi:hypothetical protein
MQNKLEHGREAAYASLLNIDTTREAMLSQIQLSARLAVFYSGGLK